MDTDKILKVAVYLGSLAVCSTALTGINFSRFMYSGKAKNDRILLVLFSFALAYLVAEFLLGLQLR